ncbi:MAG: carbonic anhydrase [Actinomycetales bacterium]|nr:carbonic anhydrase [Actinomycetales bacterium]
MPTTLTPAAAWQRLIEGNERFLSGVAEHPGQDAARRATLGYDQHPFAVMFGCSDSRVAAEIIFDQGIGDMFVVRTAGHVLDTTVIGSIEYGIEILSTPLVVILGHDHCGAVEAAMDALRTGNLPSGFVRAIVDRVIPSIVSVDGNSSASAAPELEKFGHEHVRHTVHMLHDYSALLARAVAEGKAAVVGAEYDLAEGRVRVIDAVGDIDY